MSNQKESTARTLLVALLVCLVCSVLVAGAAVALKPIQVVNSQLDKQRNILAIAGLGDPSMSAADVQRLFDERIVARLVNLETGQFSDEHDPTTFDPLAAAREPSTSRVLTGAEDIASIKRLEKFSVVYIVEDASGDMETLVLPIRGYGLWSTLHGFLALESDLTTVQGMGFYQHAETPGLGGEVDNPRWRGQWLGKQVFDESGDIAIRVVKGSAATSGPEAAHEIDGLAGATLTANGVNNLLHFWLGENGFGAFINNLRAGEV